jgi:serine/threonine protein kinase
MLKLLTCAHDHFWEAPDSNGETPTAQEVCPVCGAPAESLPLLDLASSAAPQPPPKPAPLPLRDESGRPVVAGYEILEYLGQGPTGVALYRARQAVVNRAVLLKVVTARDDLSQHAWGSLRGEATALAKLAHPNVVQVLEAGERDRQLFYNAVELVDGPTLEQKTANKPMPLGQVLALMEVLARAVHHAHEQGIVHRCLKPSCILLAPRQPERREPAGPPDPPYCRLHSADSLPKITDFGLARRPVEGEAIDAELQGGMPSYLAPEQAFGRAKDIGPATDVYGLGAILYYLLTARPPFRGETEFETLDVVQYKEPAPPSSVNRRVPADLDAICRKCLAKQPRRRYASARELAEDLRRCADGYPVQAEPPGALRRLGKWVRRRPATALLLLALLVSFTAYLAGGSPTTEGTPRPTPPVGWQPRADERAELQRLQDREQQARYYHRILLAERAWQAGNQDRANELLDGCEAPRRGWEWDYLRQRVRGDPPVALGRANEPVRGLAFSPDGRLVAVAVSNLPTPEGAKRGGVRLWNTANGLPVRAIPFGGPVRGVAFSPDGTRLAVAGSGRQPEGGLVAIYTLLQNDPVAPANAFDSPLLSIAYSPDGSLLLAADAAGRVRMLSPGRGAELLFPPDVLDGPPLQAAPLAVLSPDGNQVAFTAGRRNTVLVPEGLHGALFAGQAGPLGGPPFRELAGHTDRVTALAYSRVVDRLASASLDHTVRVWDPNTGALLHVLRGHSAGVGAVAFAPDGKRLATGGGDGAVILWDLATGEEVLPLGPFEGGVPAVAFSPDGSRLAVAHGNRVTIWGDSRNLDLRRP